MENTSKDESLPEEPSQTGHCWEHNNRGKPADGCTDCVVYKMRAQRCYDVAKLTPDIGHNRLFCKGTCQECDYYRRVHHKASSVLVITDDPVLAASIKRDEETTSCTFEVTDSEADFSVLVDHFKANTLVIDCSLGPKRIRSIYNHLLKNPRSPHVRVILAANRGEVPPEYNGKAFARLDKPFRALDIDKRLSEIQQ